MQVEVSTSTSAAVALAQVQHEQQLLHMKQEYELLLNDSRQQLHQLQEQVWHCTSLT
jgi:hypothetical protein